MPRCQAETRGVLRLCAIGAQASARRVAVVQQRAGAVGIAVVLSIDVIQLGLKIEPVDTFRRQAIVERRVARHHVAVAGALPAQFIGRPGAQVGQRAGDRRRGLGLQITQLQALVGGQVPAHLGQSRVHAVISVGDFVVLDALGVAIVIAGVVIDTNVADVALIAGPIVAEVAFTGGQQDIAGFVAQCQYAAADEAGAVIAGAGVQFAAQLFARRQEIARADGIERRDAAKRAGAAHATGGALVDGYAGQQLGIDIHGAVTLAMTALLKILPHAIDIHVHPAIVLYAADVDRQRRILLADAGIGARALR
ncbi:Uncharacterised protein [Acinetobacter baumannii]|nr:Uncharacterised protein [Acinetobacter baumannii]